MVNLTRRIDEPKNFFFSGINLDLDFIHNLAKIPVQLSMKDRAEMLEFESFLLGFFANTNPIDIALSHMKNAVGAVYEVMNLTF